VHLQNVLVLIKILDKISLYLKYIGSIKMHLPGFVQLIKDKIKGNVQTIQHNLLSAAYPTVEQSQIQSGVSMALTGIHDSIDGVLKSFQEKHPDITLTVEAFVPFLQKALEDKMGQVRGMTNQNQGVHTGLTSIADSLSELATTYMQSVDQAPAINPTDAEQVTTAEVGATE
jgi:hypothetical protein